MSVLDMKWTINGFLKSICFLIILVNKLRKHSSKPIKGNRIFICINLSWVLFTVSEVIITDYPLLSNTCIIVLHLQINWLLLTSNFLKKCVTLIQICFIYMLKSVRISVLNDIDYNFIFSSPTVWCIVLTLHWNSQHYNGTTCSSPKLKLGLGSRI